MNIVRIESEYSIGLDRVKSVSLMNDLGQMCQSGQFAVYIFQVSPKISIAFGLGYLAMKKAGFSIYKTK